MRLDLDELVSSDKAAPGHEIRRVFCPVCQWEYHRQAYAEEVIEHWDRLHAAEHGRPPRLAIEQMPIVECTIEITKVAIP